MLADMEVDKVADMEVDKVTNIVAYMVADKKNYIDIDININMEIW